MQRRVRENSVRKGSKGFTLVELVVSFAIFVIITGAAFNVLVSGIAIQKQLLAQQILIDQTSFFTEYMNRALRQARKELFTPPIDSCLTTAAGRGWNYELFDDNGDGKSERIRFIDRDDRCREFLLESSQIKEKISSDHEAGNFDTAQPLTSDDIEVVDLIFVDSIPGGSFSQSDNNQPRITFTFDVRAKGFKPDKQPAIRLQTSISQRNIDVQQ